MRPALDGPLRLEVMVFSASSSGLKVFGEYAALSSPHHLGKS